MPQSTDGSRRPLDRDRVIDGAVELADEIGLEPLTIRRLADHLGVRPMSIYHYVASKDEIVDGMVGRVFDQVERPDPSRPWKDAIADRARSLRAALRRHSWAIPIMESRRQPGADILDHHEALAATWIATGYPLSVVAHGLAVVDAFVYGFALQEASLPLGNNAGADGPQLGGDLDEAAEQIIMPLSPEAYPALTRFTMDHVVQPGYDFGDSFEPGLAIVIDGVERLGRAAG